LLLLLLYASSAFIILLYSTWAFLILNYSSLVNIGILREEFFIGILQEVFYKNFSARIILQVQEIFYKKYYSLVSRGIHGYSTAFIGILQEVFIGILHIKAFFVGIQCYSLVYLLVFYRSILQFSLVLHIQYWSISALQDSGGRRSLRWVSGWP
jgi:hypothetical protein